MMGVDILFSAPAANEMVVPDLEMFASDYIDSMSDEWQAKWDQGDKLVRFFDEHFPDELRSRARKELFGEIAARVGQSVSTIRLRYLTSKRIPAEYRAHDTSWTIHMLCAKQDQPLLWLSRVIDNGWGQTELEHQIYGAGKVVQSQRRRGVIAQNAGEEITIRLDRPLDFLPGQDVYITLSIAEEGETEQD